MWQHCKAARGKKEFLRDMATRKHAFLVIGRWVERMRYLRVLRRNRKTQTLMLRFKYYVRPHLQLLAGR